MSKTEKRSFDHQGRNVAIGALCAIVMAKGNANHNWTRLG
jgi:hypothetical protein